MFIKHISTILKLLNFIYWNINIILNVTEDFCTDPDPLVRGTDPRIKICMRSQIRTKMSRIRNTGRRPLVIVSLPFDEVQGPDPGQHWS